MHTVDQSSWCVGSGGKIHTEPTVDILNCSIRASLNSTTVKLSKMVSSSLYLGNHVLGCNNRDM